MSSDDYVALFPEFGSEEFPSLGTAKSHRKPKQRHVGYTLSENITSRYPVELHDYVLDFLHGHRPSLLACSLVCRTWYVSSRYHLFLHASTVRVDRNNFAQFRQAIEDNNDWVRSIGSLHLQSLPSSEDAVEEGKSIFLFNDELLHLTGLERLRRLTLSWRFPGDFYPAPLSATFMTGLSQNFTHISELQLLRVHVDRFTHVLDICGVLPNLRALALLDVIWSTPNNAPPEHRIALLEKLVVDCVYYRPSVLLQWLIQPNAVPSLRCLAIGKLDTRSDAVLASEVLPYIGPQLNHLILYNVPAEADLTCCTALRTLEITGLLCEQRGEAVRKDSTDRLPVILEQLHMAPLQRIVFVIRIQKRSDVHMLPLERISVLLATFRLLRKVELHFPGDKMWLFKVLNEALGKRMFSLLVDDMHKSKMHRYSMDRPGE